VIVMTPKYPERLVKYYRIIQGHAEKVAANTYQSQRAAHLKRGRKASTFKYKPTRTLEHLCKMSSDVLGEKVSVEDAMSYIAHDYQFHIERYGEPFHNPYGYKK